jgi:hypothetical protein
MMVFTVVYSLGFLGLLALAWLWPDKRRQR